MTMKPAVTIALGPPSDENQLAEFNRFQQALNSESGEDRKRPDWEDFERKLIGVFFKREDSEPSAIEMILEEFLATPVTVDEPFVGIGFVRGLWVIILTIDADKVHAPGPPIGWPPSDDACQFIASTFGLHLKRDWILASRISG
jgi:hypothetical protein